MDTIVSQKMSRGQSHEFLNKLEAAGLDEKFAQKLIESKNNKLAIEVVHLIRNFGLVTEKTSQERARTIMGFKNFFGIEEATQYFGINPSKRDLIKLEKIPFSPKVLHACKKTHILVAVLPISILQIRINIEPRLWYLHNDGWYDRCFFAKDRGEASWQLIRKNPIPGSMNKSWEEQQELLSKYEEVPPRARVLVYSVLGHFLQTGRRLFKDSYTRCSDIEPENSHVVVGLFDDQGLYITQFLDNHRFDSLGMSTVRKE